MERTTIDIAHDYVLPSYDFMLRRFESVEDRINQFATLGTTVTLAVPIIISALNDDGSLFSGWLFPILAMVSFIVFIGILYRTRYYKGIQLPHPSNLTKARDEGALIRLRPNEFQLKMIQRAGRNFETTMSTINKKHALVNWAAVFLFVELVFWALWAWKVLTSSEASAPVEALVMGVVRL